MLATPRMSVLSRPATGWTIRVAAGTGAFAPTPFTEETEETGLSRVRPLRDLRAERARGASVDVTRVLGPIEVTGTLFGSRRAIDPFSTRRSTPATCELVNATGEHAHGGNRAAAALPPEGFVALATHAWTRSTELDPDDRAARRAADADARAAR